MPTAAAAIISDAIDTTGHQVPMYTQIGHTIPRSERGEWQAKLKQIIPTYGQKLNNNLELTNATREWSSSRLGLLNTPVLPEEAAAVQAEPAL